MKHKFFQLVLSCFVALLLMVEAYGAADPWLDERQAMVRAIVKDVDETSRYIGKSKLDSRVMETIGRVPRHEFVPVEERFAAYENIPLPIGHGQTISQPYIVALMTDLMELTVNSRVLEIGTGSGYQAAILAELCDQVFSIEIIEPLGKKAAKRLQRLGYGKVHLRVGDGYYGWEDEAPFDVIIVTAAASHVPPPLIRQLKPGGRMVVPVGSRFMVQQLLLIEKDDRGEVTTRQILPVRFVPLTGAH